MFGLIKMENKACSEKFSVTTKLANMIMYHKGMYTDFLHVCVFF